MSSDQPSPAPAAPTTTVEVHYPPSRGSIGVRGNHAPLSWDHTQAPDEQEGERHLFRIAISEGELPTHDAPSWQARIAVPLQILFPQEGRAPSAS